MPTTPKSSVIDLTVEESVSSSISDVATHSLLDSSEVAILRTLTDNRHIGSPSTEVVPLISSPASASASRRHSKPKPPVSRSNKNILTVGEEVSVLKTVKLPRRPKEILVIPSESISNPLPPPDPPTAASKRCPICFDSLQNPSVTLCGHVYCTECIMTVARSSKQCPICRKKLNIKGFHPLFL